MHLRPAIRRLLIATCAIGSLLFAQIALANYVCPGRTSAQQMSDEMVAGQSCEGMDAAQPALCHQYAADASQTIDTVKVPAPSLPAIVVMHMIAVPDSCGMRTLVVEPPEIRPPPDPLFLSTLRLRV